MRSVVGLQNEDGPLASALLISSESAFSLKVRPWSTSEATEFGDVCCQKDGRKRQPQTIAVNPKRQAKARVNKSPVPRPSFSLSALAIGPIRVAARATFLTN